MLVCSQSWSQKVVSLWSSLIQWPPQQANMALEEGTDLWCSHYLVLPSLD